MLRLGLSDCCADAVQALVGIHKERSHRDLKSGNVVVSGWDGRGALKVNLVDWASSRLHTEGEHMRLLRRAHGLGAHVFPAKHQHVMSYH